MRAYAIAHGVSADAIFLDASGERTIASCLQARDPFRMTRIIVVSQEQHMARAVYTCRRVGLDADGVVAGEFTGDRAIIYQVRERFALVFAWFEVNITRLVSRRAADGKRPSSTGPEGRFRGGRTGSYPLTS